MQETFASHKQGSYPFHHRSWGTFALCRKREGGRDIGTVEEAENIRTVRSHAYGARPDRTRKQSREPRSELPVICGLSGHTRRAEPNTTSKMNQSAEGRRFVPVGTTKPRSFAQEVTLGRSVARLAIRKTLTNPPLVLDYNQRTREVRLCQGSRQISTA